MRHGKCDEQQPDGQDKPGLVGIPERPDRCDHRVLFVIVAECEQHADAEVETVENDVDEDRDAHQAGEDEGKERWPVEGHRRFLQLSAAGWASGCSSTAGSGALSPSLAAFSARWTRTLR